jgi:hypothetical protein
MRDLLPMPTVACREGRPNPISIQHTNGQADQALGLQRTTSTSGAHPLTDDPTVVTLVSFDAV